MAKYLARKCPKCCGYVGVVVSDLSSEPEHPEVQAQVVCCAWPESLLEATVSPKSIS